MKSRLWYLAKFSSNMLAIQCRLLTSSHKCTSQYSYRVAAGKTCREAPASSVVVGRPSSLRKSPRNPARGSWNVGAMSSALESSDIPFRSSDDEDGEVSPIPDVARQNLESAWSLCKQYGWVSFWFQLVLTVIAGVVILFSMAFTSQQGTQTSLYLTLFGVVTGFLSTFWSFGYVRLSRKLRFFLDTNGSSEAPRVRRMDVINMLEKGAIINVLGAAASLIGLQATIGLLVAKTLTTAAVNPFLASSANANSWSPVLAFDVFGIQATTNCLLSHFASLCITLFLMRRIANRPSAARLVTSKR